MIMHGFITIADAILFFASVFGLFALFSVIA
jgi:hypothetical protein